eukprot:SAG22_NODE_167_length_16764_cov_34.845245_6_plen_1062_part_00
MKAVATLLATLGCVAAVPMSGTHQRFMDVSATISSAYAAAADTSALRASLEATYVNSEVDVSFGDARRQLQDDTVNLRIGYTVACSSNCDAVTSSITGLSSDPTLGAAHASLVIAAINDAAAAAGFSGAVVLSTAAEVASTFTQPEQVTITLPTNRWQCVSIESGDTQTYDNIIDDATFLGDDKAITFTVQAGNDAHVGFFSDTQSTGEVYEIVLSGWGNTRSTIRPANQATNSLVDEAGNPTDCQGTAGTICTPDLLSAEEMRPFWADAVNGLVRLGTGSAVGANLLMSWQDPDHHVASYIGVMTGWGSAGTWSVCGAADAGDAPTAFTYQFSGNADDSTGGRHGVVYGASLTTDRFGFSDEAYVFDGGNGDKITVATPFSEPDAPFTIAIWMKPTIVGDGTWSGFVGYQPEDGTWQTRSPGLWLNNEDNGETAGMHYDSRHGGDQTRWNGVVPDWFAVDTYVHTLWTAEPSGLFTFYKNGVNVQTNNAPTTFSLHDSYTVGRVGCANDDLGCFDQLPYTGVMDSVEFYTFAMAAEDVALKFSAEQVADAGPSVDCGGATCSGTVRTSVDNSHTTYIQGALVGTGSNWVATDSYDFTTANSGQLVVAIDAQDAEVTSSGVGALIAEVTIGDRVFSSDESWKCWQSGTGAAGHGVTAPPGWTDPGFDDAEWPAATLQAGPPGYGGAENACNGCANIWNAVKGGPQADISTDAKWIWTEDHETHNDVFCRFTINLGGDAPPPPANLAPPVGYGYEYIGCYHDNEGARDLPNQMPALTAELQSVERVMQCVTACAGYRYMGLQWTNECFCHNSYNNGYGNNNAYGDNGEEPLSECDSDGILTDGIADRCGVNGIGDCGQKNAVYLLTGCSWDPCVDAENCASAAGSPTGLAVGYGTSPHANGGGSTGMNGIRRCGRASQSTMGWGSPNNPAATHAEPDRAIDGDRNTVWGGASCTHTDLAPAWWQLDLGSTATVETVNVWHRTQCCPDRLETAQIFVSATPDFGDSAATACDPLTDSSNEPEMTSCAGAVGQYLTVYLQRKLQPDFVGYHENTVCRGNTSSIP